MDDLRANTEYTGYTAASPVIRHFWEVRTRARAPPVLPTTLTGTKILQKPCSTLACTGDMRGAAEHTTQIYLMAQ